MGLGVPVGEFRRLPVLLGPRTGETFEGGYVTAGAYPVGVSDKLVLVPTYWMPEQRRLTPCRRPRGDQPEERSSRLAGWTYVVGCAFWSKTLLGAPKLMALSLRVIAL